MRFAEAAARQPSIQIGQKLFHRQTHDNATSDKGPCTAVDKEPSIDCSSLKAEAQRRPVTIAGDTVFCETKTYPFQWSKDHQIDQLHPAGLPLGKTSPRRESIRD